MIQWSVRIHADAKEDLRKARDWYDEHEPGVSARLAHEMEATLQWLQRDPKLCPKVDARVHFKRFPYVLYYLLQGDIIEVIAVLHGRQDESQWKSRI